MTVRSAIQIWKSLGTVWLALVIFLAITVGSAYLPMGAANGAINYAIAAVKVALIGFFFMNLRQSTVLIRLAAAAGMFWLVFMFALTAGDYLAR